MTHVVWQSKSNAISNHQILDHVIQDGNVKNLNPNGERNSHDGSYPIVLDPFAYHMSNQPLNPMPTQSKDHQTMAYHIGDSSNLEPKLAATCSIRPLAPVGDHGAPSCSIRPIYGCYLLD